jgi:uncharacterized protein YpuA (DUF1002 family)
MVKRIFAIGLALVLTIGFSFNSVVKASSNDSSNSINEQFGPPIAVFGESLTPSQKEETKTLLGITDSTQAKEVTVTGADIVKYIHGDPNSHLYSSAMITRKDAGTGLVIKIVTPDNITEVTDQMYANALLTAGIKDAEVEVASPIKVSGHSALTGIYKAYDTSGGAKLNTARTDVANQELNLATNLAKQDGLNQDKVNQLLTQIKQQMANQKPATKQDVANIVDDKLNSLQIQLSPKDRQLLIDLFNQMRKLNINFGDVEKQLSDITHGFGQKLKNTMEDKGFWQKVGNFLSQLFHSIGNLFSSLFG